MLSESQCQAIIDTAISYGSSKGLLLEVSISQSNDSTSRFANNGMTQNQSSDDVTILIRTLSDKKQSKYVINQITPEKIRLAIDESCNLIKLCPDDNSLLALPKPGKMINNFLSRYYSDTANLEPKQRALFIKNICDVASNSNLRASGIYSSGGKVTAIGNSNNLFDYFIESNATLSLTMTDETEASSWAKVTNANYHNFDINKIASKVASRAILAANPIDLAPGHYTVILEAPAVSDLLGFLWWDFSATSFLDKRSCFLDKLHKQALGKNITIYDDVYNKDQMGAPFDGEGVSKEKVLLVDKGVINSLVYGRSNASEFKAQPTGHSLPQPSIMGEYPVNIVMQGGNKSVEDMIASTDRGILLTRVWYVREVDPMTKIVTGMTRDGTFLIENGKIVTAIKNLRFNESLIDMLNRVEELGPSVLTAGVEAVPAVLPPLKVAYFNFESGTKF